MPQFRKKRVDEIEAEPFHAAAPRLPFAVDGVCCFDGGRWWVATRNGPLTISEGDWIIRGIHGDYYPCNPDIFAATYEPVDSVEGASMEISLGRIVLYTLTEDDAAAINTRRTSRSSIDERMRGETWPWGAQAHIGNTAKEGDLAPMIVVKVWSPTTVNGQVFLDGSDVLWVTSATEGIGPRTWGWPPRV